MLTKFIIFLLIFLQLTNISDMAIVTVSLQSNLVITRQGTPVAPVAPVTFLYGMQLNPIVSRTQQLWFFHRKLQFYLLLYGFRFSKADC